MKRSEISKPLCSSLLIYATSITHPYCRLNCQQSSCIVDNGGATFCQWRKMCGSDFYIFFMCDLEFQDISVLNGNIKSKYTLNVYHGDELFFFLTQQSFSLFFLLLLRWPHLWDHRSLKIQHFHHLHLPRRLTPTLWPQAHQFTTERYADLQKSHLHHSHFHVYDCHLLFKHFPQLISFVPQLKNTTFHNFYR